MDTILKLLSLSYIKMKTDCVYITCVSDSVKKTDWSLLCGQNRKVPDERDGVRITVFLYSVFCNWDTCTQFVERLF